METRAPASRHTHRQGEGQVQPSARKHPERLGIQTGGLRRWEGGQRNRRQRTMLGTDQCPGAVTQGQPHPLTNLCSSTLVACCCQPTLGKLGSGSSSRGGGLSANSCQCGISNTASRTACWHCLTDWKQATGPSLTKPASMRSAIAGCRCLTIRRESAQLAQCAAGRTRTALANPSPPTESANVDKTRAAAGALGVPKISRRHVHTLSSWRLANVSVSAGLRARSQKLALVAPQEEQESHLRVIHPWDALEEDLLFGRFCAQEMLNESLPAEGHPPSRRLQMARDIEQTAIARRKSTTRNKWDGIVVSWLVGTVESAAPAPWDLTNACI